MSNRLVMEDADLWVEEPRVLRAKETPLHTAADQHAPKLSVALRYAFAMARRALRPVLVENATVGIESIATDAMREALEVVLPKTLLKALAAGGDAGLGILQQLRHAEVAQDRAPGSEAILLHINPEVGQGSAAPLASDLRTAKRGDNKPVFAIRFDASNENAAKWAKKHAAELIDDITETSRKRIRLAIEELQEEGDWELAVDRVLAAVGDETRANLIARHESHLAASEGQRQGWDQAVDAGLLNGDEQRTWIYTPDDKVCEICEELADTVADLHGEYPGGYDGPPAHVQCRCTEGLI